ncbi:hypothetical protein OHS59_23370 [Streptomyces sp. NBC_00414]|uniref:hypothetical protein n=1 Tax=Streptomyces sp. NBC_00414 TaxID=2975739 RepID=UPI002E1E7044
MSRGRGIGLFGTAAAVTLLLSSCGFPSTGIPSTGVVEAGEAATGILPSQVVYFLRDGNLIGVRPQAGTLDIRTAVETLFRGPDIGGLQKGLTTELPPLSAAPTVGTDDGNVSVLLPPGTEPLTSTGLAQLTCTVNEAQLVASPGTSAGSAPGAMVSVTIPGTWHSAGSDETCPGAGAQRALDTPGPGRVAGSR